MWALALCPREARYCAENSRRFAPAQGRALRYWACTRRGGGLDAILSRALADWASYFGDGTLAAQELFQPLHLTLGLLEEALGGSRISGVQRRIGSLQEAVHQAG